MDGTWEKMFYSYTYTYNVYKVDGWNTFDQDAARKDAWERYKSAIQSDIKRFTNIGWEPLCELGPECIMLRKENRVVPEIYIPFGFLTFGFGFLFPMFASEKIAVPFFQVELRRRKQ